MTLTTAYLCDNYASNENFFIAEPLFRSFGGKSAFSGVITTLRCFEDNSSINLILAEQGQGRVLVIDGGGSHRCALVDGKFAKRAFANGWQGLVIYGCVRDSLELADIPIGILALHTHPLLCHGKDSGERDTMITFAGVNFRKDHSIYVDTDGIIVSETVLS